jgi:glycosyltransferase involved in cell wall biosynthesis
MNKIKVHYVSGPVGNPNLNEVWGGTAATNYIIKRAFENSDKYKLIIRPRTEFFSMEEVRLFLESGDISWIDDTSILEKYYESGYKRPDVIGPIVRSPLKKYHGGDWISKIPPEWFYSGKVLRLNEAEEKKSTWLDTYKNHKDFKDVDYIKKVSFIRHAVDLDMLKQKFLTERKYVLWAGNVSRDAKNYPLFEEIVKEVEKLGGLPDGYEFKVLSKYVIGDYYNLLDKTALLINTSKYESFCNVVAEAMSKGVPTLVREKFNGEFMFLDRPIQVKYDAESYAKKILEILNSKKLEEYQEEARKYAENNFSLNTMREDIEKVFYKIMEIKNGCN